MKDPARIFLRLALGASFLSAVADRFGLWGPPGAAGVAWGDFAHFVAYTEKLVRVLPVPSAWGATVAETALGLLLLAGWRTRVVAALSGALLMTFALSMMIALSVKAPLDYSVFTAAAGAFVLATLSPSARVVSKAPTTTAAVRG